MTGLFLAIASLVIVLATWRQWFKAALRQAVPDNLAGFVLAMATGLGLAIAAFFNAPGVVGGLLAAAATFMSVFWLLLTAAGKQKTGAAEIVVGQPLPAYTAMNEDGSSFDSQSLSGAPYLLKFFRGHW